MKKAAVIVQQPFIKSRFRQPSLNFKPLKRLTLK